MTKLLEFYRRSRKAFVAAIPLVVIGLKLLADALGDGAVSQAELVALVLALIAPPAVYAAPNTP